MSGFLFLIVGMMVGGCAATAFFCCIQAGRINDYEAEIRKLKERTKDP